MKKQVYVVNFKNRLKGQVKVYAWDEADAKKAAFAAFLYHSPMHNPNWEIDEVVGSAELDPGQTMDGPNAQPAVQVRCRAVESDVGMKERVNSAPPEDAWRREA